MPMAAPTKQWTLEELHSLPDDGNTYELIHGVLFVTPAPGPKHENVAARLTRLLDPYVAANGLGYVYHPHSILRRHGSEVEPDLMVSQSVDTDGGWDTAPTPILVVEILSPSSQRRDGEQKRDFYMEESVPEYWIVDPERQTVRCVRPGEDDVVSDESVTWLPAGVEEPLTVRLVDVFAPG